MDRTSLHCVCLKSSHGRGDLTKYCEVPLTYGAFQSFSATKITSQTNLMFDKRRGRLSNDRYR